MEKAIEKTVKPSIVDTFLKGCGKGFKVGIENITPAMILGYTLVYILQVTGLMTFLGRIFAPVMGVFGLPGDGYIHEAVESPNGENGLQPEIAHDSPRPVSYTHLDVYKRQS